jgi:hypothetical protein
MGTSKAENEDIQTIGSRRLSIAGVIIATGIELPEEAWRRLPALHAALAVKVGQVESEDTAMDLDEELVCGLRSLRYSLTNFLSDDTETRPPRQARVIYPARIFKYG